MNEKSSVLTEDDIKVNTTVNEQNALANPQQPAGVLKGDEPTVETTENEPIGNEPQQKEISAPENKDNQEPESAPEVATEQKEEVHEEPKSREVLELEEKKEKLGGDCQALEIMLKDGLIDEKLYNTETKRAEKIMSRIDEGVLRILEREELERLKSKLEEELINTLKQSKFKDRTDKITRDNTALKKAYDGGFIDKTMFEEKKKKLTERMNWSNRLVDDVNDVFEKYKDQLDNEIHMQRELIKSLEDIKRTEGETKKLSLNNRLVDLFKNTKEEKKEDIYRKAFEEIENANEKLPEEEAIVKIAFILKSVVQRELKTGQEMTYNELIDKLNSLGIDEEVKDEFINFFSKVNISEYGGGLKGEELPNFYIQTKTLLGLVKRGVLRKTISKDVEGKKELKGPKLGVVDKIRSFFEI